MASDVPKYVRTFSTNACYGSELSHAPLRHSDATFGLYRVKAMAVYLWLLTGIYSEYFSLLTHINLGN
jgi:hypothetical protein